MQPRHPWCECSLDELVRFGCGCDCEELLSIYLQLVAENHDCEPGEYEPCEDFDGEELEC